jgi:hypothetical protein
LPYFIGKWALAGNWRILDDLTPGDARLRHSIRRSGAASLPRLPLHERGAAPLFLRAILIAAWKRDDERGNVRLARRCRCREPSGSDEEQQSRRTEEQKRRSCCFRSTVPPALLPLSVRLGSADLLEHQ